jgi:uncharacterized damage-inducible protein DinB
MTQQEMKLLHAYSAWASNRIFDAVAAMPQDQVMKDMHSSHGSIHGTLVHMVGAEKIWLSRWVGKPDPAFLQPEDAPTLEALRGIWNGVGHDTAKFLAGANDRKLQEVFEMKTSKGETHRQIYWQAMLHTVDHSTYHRGQVVAMMRQLGAKPPATGMIGFFRETAKLGKV